MAKIWHIFPSVFIWRYLWYFAGYFNSIYIYVNVRCSSIRINKIRLNKSNKTKNMVIKTKISVSFLPSFIKFWSQIISIFHFIMKNSIASFNSNNFIKIAQLFKDLLPLERLRKSGKNVTLFCICILLSISVAFGKLYQPILLKC